jgi:hypothetical protein
MTAPEPLRWSVDSTGRIAAEMPAAASPDPEHFSFELRVRGDEPAPDLGGVTVGSTELPWLRAGRIARRFRYVTSRVPAAGVAEPTAGLRLDFGPADHGGLDRIELFVYRWDRSSS